MRRVTAVQALPEWTLSVTFDDGVRGVAPLRDRLFGPVFEPLRDEALFAQVRVDGFGVVCWPNGADLDSDALYARVAAAARKASVA